MNICTIATEGEWVDKHLPRWVRYIRKNAPDAELYLFYMARGSQAQTDKILGEFKAVVFESAENFGRKWLNSVRMSAPVAFGVSDILYLDCDADVLADINEIPKASPCSLLCCRSPVMHGIWPKARARLLGGMPECELNNGLIYMRRDFVEEYEAAWKKAGEAPDVPDRIRGTIAFNLMLEDMKRMTDWDTIPASYGTIWWEVDRLPLAKIVQYCNSEGQAKRLRLEETWKAAK